MNQHEPGAKLDAGKLRMSLFVVDMARAVEAVAGVCTFGAEKYTDRGWMHVPKGIERYTDALLRHLVAESREERDPESNLLHAAHAAWNAMARLELMLRREA